MNRPHAIQSRMPRLLQAFTLIELLIVVAIIAILAAIAVPNFLEAQVRSKVSRAKADMRTLATAVESYNVDQNTYPTPANESGLIEISPIMEPFETRIPPLLTTPVAYLTSLLNDVFSVRKAGDIEPSLFHYCNRNYFQAFDAVNSASTETEFNGYIGQVVQANPYTVEYYFVSHGPDLDHDDPDEGNPAIYDPTNGTTSNGDIVYFGPGSGFRN